MNSLGPDCCWCCGEFDQDHTHTVGECDWCDGTRTGVPASASLVDLPELGVAAGSEFLTLEAGQ